MGDIIVVRIFARVTLMRNFWRASVITPDFLALDRSQRRFRFESRRVVPACSSRQVAFCSQGILRRSQTDTRLVPGVQIFRASSRIFTEKVLRNWGRFRSVITDNVRVIGRGEFRILM